MARSLRIEYSGAHYHVTSRGIEKRDLFLSQKDRLRFLSYLESATDRYGAVIHAYCMMNNHYHLLVETPRANLSSIMRHVNGAYTAYFNRRHERSGHLLQGRYTSILVEADAYAKELSRYIHLNPVRAGLVASPGDYQWTSFGAYVGEAAKPEWLATTLVLGYFGDTPCQAQERYRNFVERTMGKAAGSISPLAEVAASAVLGSSSFIQEITQEHLSAKKKDLSVPSLQALKQGPSIELINTVVQEVFETDSRYTAKACIYFCHRFSGMKLRDIGLFFGLSENAISQTSYRFARQVQKTPRLNKLVEQVRQQLKVSEV